MKTLNNSKLNKKDLLAALKKRLSDKGASKAELKELSGKFDGLMAALKDHYATSLITKIEKNVIVDNLAAEFAKLKEISVNNFPPQKDFPTKMEVEMKQPSWYNPDKKIEVKVEAKDNSDVMLTGIGALFTELIRFLKGFTFKTTKIDEDYLKPQLVILHDPYSGKALDMHAVMKNAGGAASVSISGGGSGGTQVVLDSLDQYHIADGDETGTTKYYGYLDKDGNWYIMQNNTTANTYRYIKGGSGYTTNWTNRATLTYGYYDVIF